MKRILCYGDSNTWGYTPGSGVRFAPEVRWTGRVAQALQGRCTILEAGLNGRTTVYDDPCLPCRNGKSGLGYELVSRKPIDILVLSLGTNDLKFTGAAASAKGLNQLLRLCSQADICFDSGSSPIFGKDARILVISPIALHPDLDKSFPDSTFAGKYEQSRLFARHYAPVAQAWGAEFLDAGEYAQASPADCVHMDAPSHARLAQAVAEKLAAML